MATITAPYRHNEFMAGVQFTDGVAESKRPATLEYFKARGYTVTESPVPTPTPGDDWTLDALRDYARTNGIDLGGATRKDDVLDVITAPAESADAPTT